MRYLLVAVAALVFVASAAAVEVTRVFIVKETVCALHTRTVDCTIRHGNAHVVMGRRITVSVGGHAVIVCTSAGKCRRPHHH